MNRRELAKKGFLGLCGALFGKKPTQPPDPVPSQTLVLQTYTYKFGGGWDLHEFDQKIPPGSIVNTLDIGAIT